MFSRFFIDRPVFASVLAIVFVLLGGVAAPMLPVAQYPDITPPLVTVSANYPGASGQVVSDTTAVPIEQQVNGVDNMIYMESFCTADGAMTLNVTFDVGTNPNMDQVLVQNRSANAMPQVPPLVQQQGVTVRKSFPSILLAVQLYSPDGSFNATQLSNYFKIQIYDELLRLPGVGNVNILGQRDFSIRIWLDPEKLTARDLSAEAVVAAIQEQNVQVAAGVLGLPPVPRGTESITLLTTLGRLETVDQFSDIIVKTGTDGSIVRIRDIGRAELGAQSYTQETFLDGMPSVAGAVFQLPGSNAITVADAVYAKMKELSARFPKGQLAYSINYDTTLFIRESAAEVVWTLFESSFLVSLVIFIFLQNWRTALIPILSLPVSIIGAFAAMAIFGFSLNNLSLFGLVLAIGIVVDDAIVVVENVERWMEQGYPPREAAHKAMDEIQGAVFAVTLVLSCVFFPAAFITGITGQFYKQFALTIASSTLISGLNSLTLSPAMCALLLKPKPGNGNNHGEAARGAWREILPWWFYVAAFGLIGAALALTWLAGVPGAANPLRVVYHGLTDGDPRHRAWIAAGGAAAGGILGLLLFLPINYGLGIFFRGFNWTFARGTGLYAWGVGKLLRVTVLVLLVYLGLLFLTGKTLSMVPRGFIPDLDKGYLLVNVKLPDGASLERTSAVVRRVAAACREVPGIAHTIEVAGYAAITSSTTTSGGTIFCTLAPFEDRADPARRADQLVLALNGKFGGARALGPRAGSVAADDGSNIVREGIVRVFGAPPVDGLGRSGGLKLQVQDRGDLGPEALQGAVQRFIRAANQQRGPDGTPLLFGVTSTYSAGFPQYYLEIDRTQARVRGVPLDEIFNSLQVYIGSLFVNQVNLFGRTWQVNVQAEAAYRLTEEDISRIRVRNATGEMVPLGGLVSIRQVTGPEKVSRFNMYRSADILAQARPGFSSGQAIALLEEIGRSELPSSMTVAWTDLAFQEIRAGNTSFYVFIFGAVMVLLVLAAQYESWSLPFAVIMIVPMCLLCAIAGVIVRRMDNNIFTQVGLLVLVGLSSKNAILIVEFARQRRREGHERHQAVVEAARTRLRPILMTSLCFIHMVPLYFAHGAGAEMRRALGTAVLWGAFGVTLFGIFLTPVFFFAIDWLIGKRRGDAGPPAPAPTPPEEGPGPEAASMPAPAA